MPQILVTVEDRKLAKKHMQQQNPLTSWNDEIFKLK